MWWVIFSVFFALFVTFKLTGTIFAKQIELTEYNKLYRCDKCGNFHRHYQELLMKEVDPNYTDSSCPFCYSHSSLYTGKVFPWMNSNPESPQLRLRHLRKFKKTLKNVQKLSMEDESIQAFLFYYHLLPPKKRNN